MRSSRLGRRRQRGFSIIELLVAIIIIGILVAVLVPVISNRTEQARQSSARADLDNMAAAMERQAIDTGYYVRLFALNDVLRGDGIPFNREQNDDRTDALEDYLVAQPYYVFPTDNSLFIDTDDGDFSGTSRSNIINRLISSETSYTGSIVWNGPYINWHKDNNLYDTLLAPDGVPDDPWGNNYLFFTELGLVLEPNGEIVDGVAQSTDGTFSLGSQWEADIFDRPVMLSLGPNGVPGNGLAGSPDGEFGKGDDMMYLFGR